MLIRFMSHYHLNTLREFRRKKMQDLEKFRLKNNSILMSIFKEKVTHSFCQSYVDLFNLIVYNIFKPKQNSTFYKKIK